MTIPTQGVAAGEPLPSPAPLDPRLGMGTIVSQLGAFLGAAQETIEASFESFRLRVGAAALQCAASSPQLASVLGRTRVEPYPHQVSVADRITRQGYSRCLLADEVGLGKTIEAGLAIKVLSAQGLARRVLVVAPASLARQWQSEMEKKFNETFILWDERHDRRARREDPGKNPWESAGRVIVSLQYARQSHVTKLLAAIPWDVVVFDEAHHLRNHLRNPRSPAGTTSPSLGYQLAESLAGKCKGLLLLTATPMQLEPFELFSLLHLLEPGRFANFEAFEDFRKGIPTASNLALQLAKYETLREREQRDALASLQSLLKALGQNPESIEVLQEIVSHPTQQRQVILDLIARECTLSDLVIRNRKQVVFAGMGPNPRRSLHEVEIQLSPEEQRVYGAIRAYIANAYNQAVAENNRAIGFVMVILQKILVSSQEALAGTLEKIVARMRAPAPMPKLAGQKSITTRKSVVARSIVLGEGQIPVLAGFLTDLRNLRVDTKMRRLTRLALELCRDPGAKVIIFTQFRRTLVAIARELTSCGLATTTFHGGLSAEEKDQHAEEFRSRAQVMVSTEAGGEGRNFQFCHVLVNYDLPWNPMKVEQRIGRLDRIGQTRTVEVYNFYSAGTVEADVMKALVQRVKLFEGTIGGLEPILERVHPRIRDTILSPSTNTTRERFQELNDQLDREIQQAKNREGRINDALLDQRSFNPERVNELLAEPPATENGEVGRFFEAFAGKTLPPGTIAGDWRKALSIAVPPGTLPTVPASSITGTFDPRLARQREDLAFLSPDHPLVTAAITHCLRHETGGETAVVAWIDNELSHWKGQNGILWVFIIEYAGYFAARELAGVFVPKGGAPDLASGEFLVDAIRAGNGGLRAAPKDVPFPADWQAELEPSLHRARDALVSSMEPRKADFLAKCAVLQRWELQLESSRRAQVLSPLEEQLARLREQHEGLAVQRSNVAPGDDAKVKALALQTQKVSLRIKTLEEEAEEVARNYDAGAQADPTRARASAFPTLVAACIIESPSLGSVPSLGSRTSPAASVPSSLPTLAMPIQGGTEFPPAVPQASRTFQCSYCNRLFPSTGAMKSHENACKLGKHYDCSSCGALFTTKKSFELHRKTCPKTKGTDQSNRETKGNQDPQTSIIPLPPPISSPPEVKEIPSKPVSQLIQPTLSLPAKEGRITTDMLLHEEDRLEKRDREKSPSSIWSNDKPKKTGVDVRQAKRFTKSVAKYHPKQERLDEIIVSLRENHETGARLQARQFRGIRHVAYDRKFLIFYAYCPEAFSLRSPGTCEWCTEGQACTNEKRIYLLNFDRYHLLEHIR